MNDRRSVLYLSYEGMTDPLGESQVLSYMIKLAKNYHVSIISCEKRSRFAKGQQYIRGICQRAGIEWFPLYYTKKPPVFSTVYDVWKMNRKARRLFHKKRFDIVHCRSYITSLVGLQLKEKYGSHFIFDMRGFWIDERIEAGYWKQENLLYKSVTRYFRKKEEKFYDDADSIVTLTNASKDAIVKMKPGISGKINVIPTCVNLDIFKPFDVSKRKIVREELGISGNSFVLLYSGGFGANYDIHFLLKTFNKLKETYADVCLLILSKDGVTGLEKENLKGKIHSVSLPYSKVGDYLMAGDLGVINYVNHFSAAGRSPTKLGEYWACGLPAVAPPGIGDVDYLFDRYRGGGIIYDESTFNSALKEVRTTPKEVLRSFARDYFSLEKGEELYENVYKTLLAKIN